MIKNSIKIYQTKLKEFTRTKKKIQWNKLRKTYAESTVQTQTTLPKKYKNLLQNKQKTKKNLIPKMPVSIK